ncbi:hypothetical protein AJ80_04522 [Polytolypa hystricis UAMH7299]|uniref:Nodulin-like domain-containing protein n=1 Tax=Polytolypa hystricis (strain UAMH7299) TaxID=1447883 RepID=A0A2B7Y2N8_POLH7|nr:hypothetical protein AJ80_04522 [Polytolypa hystricis UAMH7299]
MVSSASPKGLKAQRLVSVVAATLIAIACGTNYAYSAWAPQFAERLKLSSTESNLIGTAGNLGMYSTGIPLGLVVDSRGPRPGALIGAVALGVGYFPIHRAYAGGPGSMGVPGLCFFAFLTGLGSCSAFMASIKTSASNFPDHRGSATAFPLAAFGLSAFFFSTIARLAFSDDTAAFLLLLSLGTATIIFVSSFFTRIIPSSYSSLPTHEPESVSGTSQLHRTKSGDSRRSYDTVETGTQQETSNPQEPAVTPSGSGILHSNARVPNVDTEETSSLMSNSTTSANSDGSFCAEGVVPRAAHNSLYADVRGLAMLPLIDFWQLFALLGLLTGVGLMTINNIGYNVKSLWKYYDDSATPEFIQKRQVLHVSTLSILSCIGRLLSGIGSDILVKKLHMSRLWCIFTSSVIFCIAQLAASQISNPHHLIAVSGITGLAYGFLFGVFPSIVAQIFGVAGISQNWGFMTLAPVIFGNIFNLLYGTIYDRHSVVLPGGERDCTEGLECYRSAYYITLYAGVASAFITLWAIWHGKRVMERQRMGKGAHERIA